MPEQTQLAPLLTIQQAGQIAEAYVSQNVFQSAMASLSENTIKSLRTGADIWCRFLAAIGIDVSQPMIDAAKDRFKREVERGVVKIDNFDLRAGFPPVLASVTLCVLTLQFTPIEYRLRIMQDIYDHIMPGGALILVEKVIGGSAKLNASMVDIYYDLKSRNGYSQEQIERKRLSLEGVLVPMTAKWKKK